MKCAVQPKSKKIIISVAALCVFIGVIIWFGTRPAPEYVPPDDITAGPASGCNMASIKAEDIVVATNTERVKAGLRTLTISPLLTKAAQLKAQDSVSKHYWAHVSPAGVQPWYWIKLAGYNYQYAGENLAEGLYDSIGVTTAWMNSPEHKANILNAHYTETGVAVTCGVTDKNTTLVVAEYGSSQ